MAAESNRAYPKAAFCSLLDAMATAARRPSACVLTKNTESSLSLMPLKSRTASACASPAGSHGKGIQRSGRKPIRTYEGTAAN